jgi:hypothetical protein
MTTATTIVIGIAADAAEFPGPSSTRKKQKRAPICSAPFFIFLLWPELSLACVYRLFGEHRFEAFDLILIVYQHYRRHAQRLLAEVALHTFPLQVLQKTVRELILGPLVPRFLPASRTAMRADKLYKILLRIAVQCSPARAAYAHDFGNMPLHFESPSDPRPHHWMRCGRNEMLNIAGISARTQALFAVSGVRRA